MIPTSYSPRYLQTRFVCYLMPVIGKSSYSTASSKPLMVEKEEKNLTLIPAKPKKYSFMSVKKKGTV